MKYICRQCFKVLNSKERFHIFYHLLTQKGHTTTITDLTRLTHLTQPTVTHHINQLVKIKLVIKKKVGREIHCSPFLKCPNCHLFQPN